VVGWGLAALLAALPPVPAASWGASSLRLVPAITPRPIPITASRNTSRRGAPQPGLLLERLGRLELTGCLPC